MDMSDSFAAKAEMLIRRAATDVFEAFVDPAITSKLDLNAGFVQEQGGRQAAGATAPAINAIIALLVASEFRTRGIDRNSRPKMTEGTGHLPRAIKRSLPSCEMRSTAMKLYKLAHREPRPSCPIFKR